MQIEGDLEEESYEEEEIRQELMGNIVSSMNVMHPILYDAYDLCELHQNQQLGVFKVVMLREICSHFKLSWKTKDKIAHQNHFQHDSRMFVCRNLKIQSCNEYSNKLIEPCPPDVYPPFVRLGPFLDRRRPPVYLWKNSSPRPCPTPTPLIQFKYFVRNVGYQLFHNY